MNKPATFFLITFLLTGTAALADDPALQVASLESVSQQKIEREKSAAGIWQSLNPEKLKLRSASALVVDSHGNDVYAKDENEIRPIASITKLMTAMVTLDSRLPLQQKLSITKADRDRVKRTGSRLQYGATLTRKELIYLALMSSENRAAAALGRNYPGGTQAFVAAMNKKAQSLGMKDSRFADPAGLKKGNLSSARDLVKMVSAAMNYALIKKATTTRKMTVYPFKNRGPLQYANTNRLLKNENWGINLSKTGYIREAGRCLTMQTEIASQPLVIVLLNSYGKLSPIGDSNRIRKWIESAIDS